MASFFYDSQLRRFVIQFMRIFSDWNVTRGQDPLGNPIYQRVPIMYGDSSRNAATIIANNSASNMPSAPMMSAYISGVEFDQTRTQDPYFVDTLGVRQRTYNPVTREYETTQGDAFTIKRLMPVPYTLRMTLDIWTTNEQQHHEIFEQLAVLFNPSLEVQSTDNFIDWTSLSVLYQDGLNWSSRTIPQGSGNPINITSWKFYMPVWVSSPIKVEKLGIIHKVIASIYKGSALTDMTDDDLLLGTRQKITPYGYQLLLIGNQLQILPAAQPFYPDPPLSDATELPPNPDTAVYWQAVINAYGTIRPGISQIRIENPYLGGEIVGTIAFNPTDDRLMIYNIDVDTLPQNTLAAVDMIIDPQAKTPGNELPAAANGQRYLVVNEIGSDNYLTVRTAAITPAGDGTTPSIKVYLVSLPDGTIDQPFEVGTQLTAIDEYGLAYLPPNSSVASIGTDSGGTYITIGNGTPSFQSREMPRGTYIKTNIWIGTAWGQFYNNNSADAEPVALVNKDSIIEYDGNNNRWFVSFDAVSLTDVQYVTNLNTNIQYRWAEGIWMKAWEGWYPQGDWNIVI
jgi:hypothetical protein